MPAKAKVTVTLDPKLVAAVDECAKELPGGSRSAVIEQVLKAWYERQELACLERETEAYYQSLTKIELEENRLWAQGASQAARRLWDD